MHRCKMIVDTRKKKHTDARCHIRARVPGVGAAAGVQPLFPPSDLALHGKGCKKRDIMLINNSNTSLQTSRVYLLHHPDQAANRRR
jgi:hypothetical protein